MAASLREQAMGMARQAVEFDTRGDKSQARMMYTQAATLLHQLVQAEANPALKVEYGRTLEQYIARAEALSPPSHQSKAKAAGRVQQREEAPDVALAKLEKRASSVYKDAIEQHEERKFYEAKQLYGQAAELFLKAAAQSPSPADVNRFNASAAEALTRAERLKQAMYGDTPPRRVDQSNVHAAPSRSPRQARAPGPRRAKTTCINSGGGLTDAELKVLEATSQINGRLYLPWVDADEGDQFKTAKPFVDPEGRLALSPKQKAAFGSWVRPKQVSSSPKMIVGIGSETIKQTVVSDCSFVSSLAISADYERRFQRRLITDSIYPQDSLGNPIYNPHGKYVVRLFINGVWRKVVIDDLLPMSKSGQLLCSFSKNRSELWVSLIEKAYLKIMGGYDFPGSNSAIDLHALSGWIPERLSLREATDEDWVRLQHGLHKGNALITMATGPLAEAEADRAGLVPTHAYAVLDLQTIDGLRLVKMKNPWSHLRWKGNYSPSDKTHWSLSLQARLRYDPERAEEHDNGEFWIDYASVLRFFDVAYMNWNPDLFKHRYSVHLNWPQKAGPIKDTYTLEYNPQYSLEIEPGFETATVWVLLSRHITRIDDFANNEEYITVHVYRGGKKVYYTDDPVHQGVKINSPHYLAKLHKTKERNLTLVISQYEKSNTINCSLRVFCTSPFKLRPIRDPYKVEKKFDGKWTAATAGGCGNDMASFTRNPKYILTVTGPGYDDPGHPTAAVRIKLAAPKQYAAGITVLASDGVTSKNSGAYRPGFSYMEMSEVKLNTPYTIVPATYDKNQLGPFFLTVGCTTKFTIKQVQ